MASSILARRLGGLGHRAGRGADRKPGRPVLDRTAEITEGKSPPLAPADPSLETENGTEAAVAAVAPYRFGWLQRAWQFFIAQTFSSLTRRIVFLNVTGLLAPSVGI